MYLRIKDNLYNLSLTIAILLLLAGTSSAQIDLFPRSLNGVQYVGSGSGGTGDIGAQINAAYAVLPAAGGEIHIIQGSYSFSTPIIIGNTVGKTARLVGQADATPVLTYTGTTGIAITLAGGQGNQGCGQLENFTLYGSGNGNSITGIQFASATVGCSGATVKNVNVGSSSGATLGFATCINWNETGAVSYLTTIINSHVQGCTVGLALAGEGNSILGGLVGNNATGATCTSASQVTLQQVSFDDNTTVGFNSSNAGCKLSFISSHFENAANGTDFYYTQSAGFSEFYGGDGFQNDDVNGSKSAQFATISGGMITYDGGVCSAAWTGADGTMAQMFNLSGSTNAVLHPRMISNSACTTSSPAAIFNSAYTGGAVEAISFISGSNTPTYQIMGSIPTWDLNDIEANGQRFRFRAVAGALCGGTTAGLDLGIVVAGNDNPRFDFCTGSGVPFEVIQSSGTGQYNIQVPANAKVPETVVMVGQLASTSQKAETGAADANVLTYTPPAVIGTYRACVSISVTSATGGTISWTLSWTDSSGNAQANIAQDLFQDGTAAPATTFTTSAAGNYHMCRELDINNAAANIVVKWVGGGTTAAKMSAAIERLI